MRQDAIHVPATLAGALEDQERTFYELGAVWAAPPTLYQARCEPGVSTHRALQSLLDQIEAKTAQARHLRPLLAACYGDLTTPTPLMPLLSLSENNRQAMLAVWAWIARVNEGLQLDDFADRGARFRRLVLRESSQTASTNSPGEAP
ncbi:DUF7673 family protein [Hydrocarboniphaga effusa]|jgi:hypothetical protein|uniref:DUF7673 family protein n=1 Tax=Hydrocarboniphaga effusa TaxID=243629 RepID=UPI003BAC62AF